MNPSVWGAPFWFVMHTVSLNYPMKPSFAEQRTHYDFFYNVRDILPCEMCRQHYRTLLKQHPIQPFLDNRDSLVAWVVLIHNQVNARLGKPSMTKEAFLRNYHNTYERNSFCSTPKTVGSDGIAASSSSSSSSSSKWYASRWMGVLYFVLLLALVVTLIRYIIYRRACVAVL
jgi:hypothetical protein